MSKDDFERSIFSGFVGVLRAEGSIVILETLRQLAPPHPDIVCHVDGLATGFELTMATTESLQEAVSLGKDATGWLGGEALAAFRGKVQKRYPAFSGPIDLVIHESAVANLGFTAPWIDDFRQEVRRAIATTAFRTVWVVSYDGAR